MITQEQIFLVVTLIAIEIFVLALSVHPRTKKFFDVLPPVFWIYFLPMVCSTLGIIDSRNPIFKSIPAFFLPVSLFLLLIAVDIRAIFKLGRMALLMFFIGSFGMVLGAVISFAIFKQFVGGDFAAGFGALSASWTGGSANMIAVKEALRIPETIFTPMVVVDTIVPYVWMALLIASVGLQKIIDQKNGARRQVLDDLAARVSVVGYRVKTRGSFPMFVCIVLLGFFASWSVGRVAGFLPEVKGVISTYAWAIVLVTCLGIGLSFSSVRKLEQYGSTKIGYYILYFVLTTIGAKASLAHIQSGAILIVAGFVMVLIHAIVMIVATRALKVPMFLAVTASQANIGGVASAPVVAEIYQPGLSCVGLLLAILGNIVGTYIGILTAQLCRHLMN